AYARKADAGAKLLFRQSLSAKNERVREAAAQSLAILSGVENPSEFVFEQLDDGWDAMSEPQRLYYAVLIYDGEVNNGGHSQYFVNSSGDFYPLAIAGLKAIKAPKRARILSEALALFGDVGPSQDNDRRHDELASFTEAQDRILSKLDDRYYACDEDIDVLLALYALDNKEHFRRAK
ncbi:MAG TPA: DMP19 family protein, partial [Lacipirellulaceae bacterium]|nr:DMP19 family protein [Lacipirellulaceae bacterium]